MSTTRHVLVLAALVVNLWLGGDLVEAVGGHLLRVGFELTLLLAYLRFMWGFPGRIRPTEEERDELVAQAELRRRRIEANRTRRRR